MTVALQLTARERRWLAARCCVVVVAVRLATLGAYPLMDPTESRYAEIARKMLETGNWLMPQFDYGVPFWGKPPLSTWLSAAAMAVFGVNEFAARLPSLLLLAGCGALVVPAGALRARPRRGAVDAGGVRDHRARVHRRRRRDDRPGARVRHDAVDGGILGRGARPRIQRAARRDSRSSSGSPSGCWPRGPSPSCSRCFPIGAWTLWTRRWRAVWTRAAVARRHAADGRAGRAVVLGRGARVAGIPRLFPGRRALEALRRAGLEGRSLRRGARPAARHDLAVLDRGRAAVVAAGASAGSRARCATARRRCAPLAARSVAARTCCCGRWRRCCSSRCPATCWRPTCCPACRRSRCCCANSGGRQPPIPARCASR